MTTAKTIRTAARTVLHAGGARSYVAAVTLVAASAVKGCRCTGCYKPIERGAEMVVSSRDSDLRGVFDVDYCSIACRTKAVSA